MILVLIKALVKINLYAPPWVDWFFSFGGRWRLIMKSGEQSKGAREKGKEGKRCEGE